MELNSFLCERRNFHFLSDPGQALPQEESTRATIDDSVQIARRHLEPKNGTIIIIIVIVVVIIIVIVIVIIIIIDVVVIIIIVIAIAIAISFGIVLIRC